MNLTMLIHHGDGSIREEVAVSSIAEAHGIAEKAMMPSNGFVRVIETSELERARAMHPHWPRSQVPPSTGGDFIGRADVQGQYSRKTQ